MSRIGMQAMECRIEGHRLLMHKDTLADPLHPSTKRMKKLSGNKKKTDETHRAMSDVEWEAGLYYAEGVGPYIPPTNVLRMLEEAAKQTRKGKDVRRAVHILVDHLPLLYAGPRDFKSLSNDVAFRDRRAIVVARRRVMRTRPIFRNWALKFTLVWINDKFTADELTDILCTAGQLIGLGDYRPTFGRFVVASAEPGMLPSELQ